MEWIDDQQYLRKQQYRAANRLQARISLHQNFNQNKYAWMAWVYDQMFLEDRMRVLEVGCGTGALWLENYPRLAGSLDLTLVDLSLGMVKSSRTCFQYDPRFHYRTADVQALPFRDGSFDVVVANHMLYHVPDLKQAVQEMNRVLRPGGRLYAATNGMRHMAQVYELIKTIDPGYRENDRLLGRFSLHNAASLLAPAFTHIQVTVYPDSLWVTEVEPLVSYIQSMWGMDEWTPEQQAQLHALIEARIAAAGGVLINKSSGLVKARKQ